MLTALAIAARVLLCAVFAVAGAAKLADRPGTQAGVFAFGVPRALAAPLALALPLAELATAALVLPRATAVTGALAGLALLALFSVVIGWNLMRGRTPECHCFGQLHSAPAGPRTLARNGVLAAGAAAVLVADGGPSVVSWVGRLHDVGLLAFAAGLCGAALAAGAALAFASLLQKYGRALARIDGLESALTEAGIVVEPEQDPVAEIGLAPGSPIPPFAEIEELLAEGLPLLLLFTSPSCAPCKALLPHAAAWQRDHAGALIIAFASDGAPAAVRAEAEELELLHVLVDTERRFHDAFEANGTPSAVLIAPEGRIDSWVAAGRDSIEDLLARAVEEPAGDPGRSVGARAPALELASLDGEPRMLTDFEGRDTLLLFWNPGCGFCRALLPDLLAWERSTNGTGPRLVVVSSGDADSTRSDGFASTVLLDASFAAGEAFGANGTPMAVLLAADGRVASPVAAGADNVLTLAQNGHA